MNDDITTIVAAAAEPGIIVAIAMQVDMIAKGMLASSIVAVAWFVVLVCVLRCGGIFVRKFLQKSQRVTRAHGRYSYEKVCRMNSHKQCSIQINQTKLKIRKCARKHGTPKFPNLSRLVSTISVSKNATPMWPIRRNKQERVRRADATSFYLSTLHTKVEIEGKGYIGMAQYTTADGFTPSQECQTETEAEDKAI
eukprot:scaffold3621_cov115-Skeletonema_dohrnii-CCMP3373.AAC.1